MRTSGLLAMPKTEHPRGQPSVAECWAKLAQIDELLLTARGPSLRRALENREYFETQLARALVRERFQGGNTHGHSE